MSEWISTDSGYPMEDYPLDANAGTAEGGNRE